MVIFTGMELLFIRNCRNHFKIQSLSQFAPLRCLCSRPQRPAPHFSEPLRLEIASNSNKTTSTEADTFLLYKNVWHSVKYIKNKMELLYIWNIQQYLFAFVKDSNQKCGSRCFKIKIQFTVLIANMSDQYHQREDLNKNCSSIFWKPNSA